jgi:hypothetical protein
MKSSAFKLAEGFEKYGYECLHILSSVLSGLNGFTEVCVREAYAHADEVLSDVYRKVFEKRKSNSRLVKEEQVRFVVPGIWIP